MANQSTWYPLELFSSCEDPAPATVVLPQSIADPPARLLIRRRGSGTGSKGRTLIASTGVRSTSASGACAQPGLLVQLGGPPDQVAAEYRAAGLLDVLTFTPDARLSAALAATSLAATLAAAYATFSGVVTDPSKRGTLGLATFIFAINCVVAILKAVQDYRKV